MKSDQTADNQFYNQLCWLVQRDNKNDKDRTISLRPNQLSHQTKLQDIPGAARVQAMNGTIPEQESFAATERRGYAKIFRSTNFHYTWY